MTKRKPKRGAEFDIAKMIDSPVRAIHNGRATTMPPFEAEVRQHLARAVKGKSVPSMRWLLGLADKYRLLAAPTKARMGGVVAIPKDIPDGYQREIFDSQPEPGQRDWYLRIAIVIARWFEERAMQKEEAENNEQ